MHLFLWRLYILKKQRIRVTEYYILLDGTSANKKERFHTLSLSLSLFAHETDQSYGKIVFACSIYITTRPTK